VTSAVAANTPGRSPVGPVTGAASTCSEPVTCDRAATAVPPLRRGVCQVWWAGLDDVRPEHDSLLADVDLQRRSRLALPADRQRLTAAWAVARVVLGAATGTPPDRLCVDRSCLRCGAQHGKPWLPAAPDVHLSVAHSGDCIAVAVARGTPIGVDVEAVVQLGSALDILLGATLAVEERAALAGRAEEERDRGFTTYWARKEAVLKATGDGLASPMEELVVSPPSEAPRVLHWAGHEALVGRLSLHAVTPPPGWCGALAVLGGPSTHVVECDAGALLQGVLAG
jgi:4'-phosphopantetheinyl transferase